MSTEVRVGDDDGVRQTSDGYLRVTAATQDDTNLEVRIDTDNNVRFDTDGFIRITANASGGGSPVTPGTVPIPIEFGNGVGPRVVFTTPPQAVIDGTLAGVARIARFVDIYESDNETLWAENVKITGGEVTVDSGRDERRNIELTIADDSIVFGPDDLWYDKIVKPYRGLHIDGVNYVAPLGEFMIDQIRRPHFPTTISISGRDFTKKLMLDKFADTIAFQYSADIETTIRNLALNGGIPAEKLRFETTDYKAIGVDTSFDRYTSRWEAMKSLADSAGYELFFDAQGYLVYRQFVDPLTAPTIYGFQTGPNGNLVEFERTADDSRLFNEVVVGGNGQENGLIYGVAQNTEPSSPTRISRLGRRTMEFPVNYVQSDLEAQQIAERLLKVAALEQYNAGIQSVVVPWLEAGEAVLFVPDDIEDYEPTRFLLSSFTIPMSLEPMSADIRRIHIVG